MAWNSFLNTPTGQRLLEQVALSRPDLLSGGDTNNILIRSGEARQHEILVSLILTLAGGKIETDVADPVPSSYPDLNDDTMWNDGKSVNPEPQE